MARVPWEAAAGGPESGSSSHSMRDPPAPLLGQPTWASPAGSPLRAQDGGEVPPRQWVWRLNDSKPSGVGHLGLQILDLSLFSWV